MTRGCLPCDEDERDARRPGAWTCLPPTDDGFVSQSALARTVPAARALNELIAGTTRDGILDWMQADDVPALPWRSNWEEPEQQRLVDDYTAYVSPYLLTLPQLDEALRESLERQAVQQLDLIEFVFPLLPMVLDAGRMEVARVKARLAGN